MGYFSIIFAVFVFAAFVVNIHKFIPKQYHNTGKGVLIEVMLILGFLGVAKLLGMLLGLADSYHLW